MSSRLEVAIYTVARILDGEPVAPLNRDAYLRATVMEHVPPQYRFLKPDGSLEGWAVLEGLTHQAKVAREESRQRLQNTEPVEYDE